MKCSRISLSLWCTALGGAVIAMASIGSRGAYACDPYGDGSLSGHWTAQYDMLSSRYSCPPQTAEDTPSTDSADTASNSSYRYEYPEDESGSPSEETTDYSAAGYNGYSAEAYAFKYGYHYASSGKLYGDQQANEATDASTDASHADSSKGTNTSSGDEEEYGYEDAYGHESSDAESDTPADDSSAMDDESTASDGDDPAAEDEDDDSVAEEDAEGDTHGNLDESDSGTEGEQPVEEVVKEAVEQSANARQNNRPYGEDAWTYECYDFDPYYGDAGQVGHDHASPASNDGTASAATAEPDTLVQCAKWVFEHGCSFLEKWLGASAAGQIASQSAPGSAEATGTASTSQGTTYDISGENSPEYEGAEVSARYGHADYLNQDQAAEDDCHPSEPASSAAADTNEECADPAESANDCSSYDAYGYEKSYAEFSYGQKAVQPTNEVSADTDHTEIWNRYRYEYYYHPENSENNQSLPDGQAQQDKPCATEQASVGGVCDFEYGYEKQPESTTESSSSGISEDEQAEYNHADPYAYYGYDYRGYHGWQAEPQETVKATDEARESGLESLGWTPAELLIESDQDLLRTLERLSEEPSGVRRAVLNTYLENIGSQCLDFVTDFEDTTKIEVLGLADDVLGTAALLSAYRLMERGELGHDEAIDLLRRSLQNGSTEWARGVRAITANAYETGLFADPSELAAVAPTQQYAASGTALMIAAKSLSGVGEAIWGVVERWSTLDWGTFLLGLSNDRAASHEDLGSEWFQR